MAGSLVVVAIPDENDRVWKISSEKVPHLTLLFLGEDADEVPNVDQIMLFTEHAANTMLRRFYLTVDRRGELGEDKADVLFFKKNRYDFKAAWDFRAALLQDANIKKAYDAASQFDGGWKPHLTLGYPETPAKPIPDDQHSGFFDVQFNRIAVWTGDYNGPEFLLKDYWEDFDMGDIPMDVAMSEIAHYGVKGMKWGVRKEPGSETRRSMFDPEGHDKTTDIIKAVVWPAFPPLGVFAIPAQVRLVRAAGRGVKAKAVDIEEQKFAAKAQSHKNFVEIHNRSGERFNREIGAINEKHPGDLTKSPKKQKAYDDDVLKLMQDSYREAANSVGNKRRTMHLDLDFRGDGMDFVIKAKEGPPSALPERIKHADGDDEPIVEVTLTGKIQRNATGHILGFKFDMSDEMAQTADLGAEFLLHYGVKGMKWGVRNKRPLPQAVAPKATSKVPHGAKRKTKVQVEGGENHPASADAIKVAEAAVKLRKSGTAALSNKELQELQTRLNLERNVTTLVRDASVIGKGRKFVKEATGFNREVNTTVDTGLQTAQLARRVRSQFA